MVMLWIKMLILNWRKKKGEKCLICHRANCNEKISTRDYERIMKGARKIKRELTKKTPNGTIEI
jgi:hypothetical protein